MESAVITIRSAKGKKKSEKKKKNNGAKLKAEVFNLGFLHQGRGLFV